MPKTQPAAPIHHRTAIGQRQREQTRLHIVRCAVPVFGEHGPDAPVVEDFIKAAGVSRGTFYNYFQTTRELLDASVGWLSDNLIETIVPAVADLSNPVIRLATGARIYYRMATTEPVFGAFLASASGIGTLAQQHMLSDLQESLDQGLIDVPDLDLAAAVAAGVMVYALRSPRARRGGDARGLAVVRAILAGLGVAPALAKQALAVPLPKVEMTLRAANAPDLPARLRARATAA